MRHIILGFLVSFIGFDLQVSSLEAAKDRSAEHHFESFGDSISSAGMSGFSLEAPDKPIASLQEYIMQEPWSLNALGIKGWWSGIWRSTKKKIVNQFDWPENSWSTGTEVRSLATYLKEEARYTNLQVLRRAVMSSKAQDFLVQVHQSLDAQKIYNYQLDFATVLIGANNYCRDAFANIENAAKEFEEGFRLLLDRTPAKIFYISLPDANVVRPLAAKRIKRTPITCQTIWSWKEFYCHRILGAKEDWAREEVKIWQARWQTIVENLEREYPNRILVTPFSADPVASDISIDCFHPSKQGQQKIADRVVQNLKSAEDFLAADLN